MNFDSFFIKAQFISHDHEEAKEFGSITPGATFRYIMTSQEDDKQHVRVASQQPQQSYDSLDSPYVYMGVGRSNNYIEQLNVAYSVSNKLD